MNEIYDKLLSWEIKLSYKYLTSIRSILRSHSDFSSPATTWRLIRPKVHHDREILKAVVKRTESPCVRLSVEIDNRQMSRCANEWMNPCSCNPCDISWTTEHPDIQNDGRVRPLCDKMGHQNLGAVGWIWRRNHALVQNSQFAVGETITIENRDSNLISNFCPSQRWSGGRVSLAGPVSRENASSFSSLGWPFFSGKRKKPAWDILGLNWLFYKRDTAAVGAQLSCVNV